MECEERLERLQRAVDQGQSWIYEDSRGLDLILCKQEYVWLTFRHSSGCDSSDLALQLICHLLRKALHDHLSKAAPAPGSSLILLQPCE